MSEENYDDAVQAAEEVLGMLEDIDEEVYEKADEFFDSIDEKVRSILKTVEDSGKASEAQIKALENMKAGVAKWIH